MGALVSLFGSLDDVLFGARLPPPPRPRSVEEFLRLVRQEGYAFGDSKIVVEAPFRIPGELIAQLQEAEVYLLVSLQKGIVRYDVISPRRVQNTELRLVLPLVAGRKLDASVHTPKVPPDHLCLVAMSDGKRLQSRCLNFTKEEDREPAPVVHGRIKWHGSSSS